MNLSFLLTRHRISRADQAALVRVKDDNHNHNPVYAKATALLPSGYCQPAQREQEVSSASTHSVRLLCRSHRRELRSPGKQWMEMETGNSHLTRARASEATDTSGEWNKEKLHTRKGQAARVE